MILHIPHSSTNTLNKTFLCDINLELRRMTDIDTDILFQYPTATTIIAPVSRLICDMERFEDDNLEIMSSKGMGVCYTTNSFGEPLREFTINERENIVDKYYKSHHLALSKAVDNELENNDASLVVDCHSFSNIPLPHEPSQSKNRPDICIGVDDFHTPQHLVKSTKDYFESCGYSVAINDPFAGTLIPIKHYYKNKQVQGIMIEVNRNLYKDNFESVKFNITNWLDTL